MFEAKNFKLEDAAANVVVVLVVLLAVDVPRVALAKAVVAPETSILDLCWRQLVRTWAAKAVVAEQALMAATTLWRLTRHRYERCVSLRAPVVVENSY